MKFELENIGAIGKANITIDGITIIAGENNVGKSTVGKALYAFLHDMGNWQKTYRNICSLKVERFFYQRSIILEDRCMEISGAKRRRTSKAEQIQKRYSKDENFLVAIEDFQIAEDENNKRETRRILENYLLQYYQDYVSLYVKNITTIAQDDFEQKWINEALEGMRSLELDELKIQMKQLKQSFQEVFNKQYRKVGTSESSIVFVDDEGRSVRFSINDVEETLDQPIRVSNKIFFVESPKIYDYLSNPQFGHVQKECLQYLMSPNIFKHGIPNVTPETPNYVNEQSDNKNALQDITEQLEKIMGGRAEFFQKVGLEFKDEHISEPIHSVNVSTGLKSMALLEYALRIGAIEEGDILILDEPEINLHPEWQVEYARSLVELQKIFRLKIIITSHSPYFIRAIECFTDINDSMEQLNVYRMSKIRNKNGSAQVENVSYSEFGMTDLYDALSAPLEDLESLLDKKYGVKE